MAENQSSTNGIPERQNAAPQLKLLRAQRHLYNGAKEIVTTQIILTLIVPLIGAGLALIVPAAQALVAFGSLVIVVLDAAILDHLYKGRLEAAARTQEQFDVAVLALSWDAYSVGAELEPETIHEAASELTRSRRDVGLDDWYPTVVESVPIHQARLICQRTNLWYDSKIRRRYGTAILVVMAILVVVLLAIGIAGGMTLTSFVMVVAAPATPFMSWGLREFYRQRDVAAELDRLRTQAENLWKRVKDERCPPEQCTTESRALQTAIFTRRSNSPPVFNWIYRHLRSRTEEQMNEGAAQMVASLNGK